MSGIYAFEIKLHLKSCCIFEQTMLTSYVNKEKIAMRTEKPLTSNKYLNIKEVVDPENNVNGYQYAERLGVDSVAFICYDKKTNKYLLNEEYTPPTNEFLIRAFGGSIDKNKTKVKIVIDEVREEAGFDVKEEDVVSLGRAFVSTQMNQYCYLYLVNVDKTNQKERHPENAIEAMAKTKWLTEDEIVNGEDWKAITIVNKMKRYNEGFCPDCQHSWLSHEMSIPSPICPADI